MIKSMVSKMTKAALAWRRGASAAAALLALSGSAISCADHVQSAVVACPCDTGVCCESGVCAANQNACEQATQALSSEAAGHWTGYIENHMFSSGSDALDLTLESGGDGVLTGQLKIGAGTPPSPATDPDVGWPHAGFAKEYFDRLTTGVPAAPFPIFEGFSYRMTQVHWTALRLRFEIALQEPWGSWCRLQQPIVWQGDPPTVSCEPENTGVGGAFDANDCQLTTSAGELPYDCDKGYLCTPNYACACTASGCDAATGIGFSFDVSLRGNDGDGSIRDQPFDDSISSYIGEHNVRFIRASN